MNKKTTSILLGMFAFLCVSFTQAQEKFYATTPLKDAKEVQAKFPDQITILDSNNGEAAVYISKVAAEELHHRVVVHGPGYVFEPTKNDALASIKQVSKKSLATALADFTIDQQDFVKPLLSKVSKTNVVNHIKTLENYGTRYHTTSSGKKSSTDLKAKWEGLVAGRSDASVRFFQHSSSSMPSVILTIEGSESPNEFVVLGGHLDSTNQFNNNDAPGADDNASGIATITEVIRILMEADFKPKKTVEFMAFSAEEVGLVGSNEIAKNYSSKNINIVSMLQLDMTNYRGSSSGDMSISNDTYVSSEVNQFLKDLISTYNSSGANKISYTQTKCNYGCSDHYSFSQQGYRVAFPFEAKFEQSNKKIHTADDTLANSDPTGTHASRFVKLGLEYIVEAAKHGGSAGDTQAPTVPTSLTASNTSQTGVKLTWNASTDNVGVEGYEIYSSGTLLTTTTTTEYQVTGLTPDTNYSFTVKAFDAAKNKSGDSNKVDVKTLPKVDCNTKNVVLDLVTDRYPEDISWTVKDQNGNTVLNGAGYDKETTYKIEECLPVGCYTFEILDSYKDGICCTYGEGSFVLTLENKEIARGGEYGAGTSAEFCVGGNNDDKEAPTAPRNLKVTSKTTNSVSLSWTASTDNVGVTEYQIYQGREVVGTSTTTNFTVTSLSPNTKYTFKVTAKDAAGNTSADSEEVSATTNENSQYCSLKGNDVYYEWIDFVGLNNLSKSSSADGGYADYTSETAQLNVGSNTITLSAGFRGSAYAENWFVWIDFDGNGEFSSSELVVEGSSSDADNFQKSFNVPSNAVANTRMRVAMSYNATTEACGSFSYGEVEDYSVSISSSKSAVAISKGFTGAKQLQPVSITNDFMLFPNPVKEGSVTIQSTRLKDGVYQVFDILGNVQREGKFKNRSVEINVGGLSSGNYIVKISNARDAYSAKLIVE